jgi:hypothetical protein
MHASRADRVLWAAYRVEMVIARLHLGFRMRTIMGRKTTAEMVGEALRELGVLLALFGPLERVIVKGEPVPRASPLRSPPWSSGS